MQKARNWAGDLKEHEKDLKCIVRNEERASALLFFSTGSVLRDSTFTKNP